jgi:hypothetical protein
MPPSTPGTPPPRPSLRAAEPTEPVIGYGVEAWETEGGDHAPGASVVRKRRSDKAALGCVAGEQASSSMDRGIRRAWWCE